MPDIGELHFCQIVQDAHGKKFLLIAGEVLSFDAPLEQNNGWVEAIASALRCGGRGSGGVEEAKTGDIIDKHPWLWGAVPSLPNHDRLGLLTPDALASTSLSKGL